MDTLNLNNFLLMGGVFLLLGAVANKPSSRYGVPALLLYIAIGFIFGNGGAYDFLFDFPDYVAFYSQFAIGCIVFIGGLSTPLKKIKNSWFEGSLLSSLGVFLTTGLVGLFCHLVFGLDLISGFLMGAVLSATDAAAVFSILQANNMKLKENVADALEFEASTNDPMAFSLTVTLTSLVALNQPISFNLVFPFLNSIILGIVLGSAISFLIILMLRKVEMEIPGLYPIIVLSGFFIIIGASPIVGANPLLALYVAGVIFRNYCSSIRKHSMDFFGGLSWLMQISLFIVLGLQANPSRILDNLGLAISVMVFLIIVARPAAVWTVYLFKKASLRKKLLVSWIGLRGATPIAFALIPLTQGVDSGYMLFDVALVTVFISVLIQGTTLKAFAKRLNMLERT